MGRDGGVRLGGLSALATVAAAAALAGPAAPQATCGKLLAPQSGAYFSAHPDFNPPDMTTEDDVRASRVVEFERLAGRRLVWAAFSQYWFKGLEFPRASVVELWRAGRVPYVWMLPTSGVVLGLGPPHVNPEKNFTLDNILAGKFDAQLRAWARAARDTNIPIVAEYGTEVNNDWGPWHGIWNGAGETTGYGDGAYPDGAERFRDTYRHIVRLFREEGATNVTWVFHVDSWPPHFWWNEVQWYYPGDEYVDWVGISNYGTLDARGPILDFAEKLDVSGMYDKLRQLSRRPFAVIEMGTVDDPAGGKAAWIRSAFTAIRTRYRDVRAVAWYSMNHVGIDTRFQSSPESLAAFRAAVADPYFGARPQFSGNCAPSTPRTVAATRGGRSTRVTWRAVPNAAYYSVWRSDKKVATTPATRFDDRRGVRGRRYSYSVRAVNIAGRSALSRAVVGWRR